MQQICVLDVLQRMIRCICYAAPSRSGLSEKLSSFLDVNMSLRHLHQQQDEVDFCILTLVHVCLIKIRAVADTTLVLVCFLPRRITLILPSWANNSHFFPLKNQFLGTLFCDSIRSMILGQLQRRSSPPRTTAQALGNLPSLQPSVTPVVSE